MEIIEKGKENCSKIQVEPKNHFAEVRKMVEIGSGAHREQIDYVLSRTACYLIALNADAGKTQIAWAKAYFIVQTRCSETKNSMTKEQLWKIYTQKNPSFADTTAIITIPARGLKKLFDQTWEQASTSAVAKKTTDALFDKFFGGRGK